MVRIQIHSYLLLLFIVRFLLKLTLKVQNIHGYTRMFGQRTYSSLCNYLKRKTWVALMTNLEWVRPYLVVLPQCTSKFRKGPRRNGAVHGRGLRFRLVSIVIFHFTAKISSRFWWWCKWWTFLASWATSGEAFRMRMRTGKPSINAANVKGMVTWKDAKSISIAEWF